MGNFFQSFNNSNNAVTYPITTNNHIPFDSFDYFGEMLHTRIGHGIRNMTYDKEDGKHIIASLQIGTTSICLSQNDITTYFMNACLATNVSIATKLINFDTNQY